MSTVDPSWKIIRCPECDGLMKIATSRAHSSLACPGCGVMLSTGDGEEDSEPEGDHEPEEHLEVISNQQVEVGEELQLDPEELALDVELGKIPEITLPPPRLGAAGAGDIPMPRKEDYTVPELISNIGGERGHARLSEHAPRPKLDPSKLVSIDDARFAPAPEAEEGAVQSHVARKITGWDIEEGEAEIRKRSSEPESDFVRVRNKLGLVGIGLVSISLLGVVAFGLVQSLKDNGSNTTVKIERPVDEARETFSQVERDVMDNSKETFAAAGEAIEKFLNAPSYLERLEFVRVPERVKPLMENYYKNNPDEKTSFRVPEKGWMMSPYKSFLLGQVTMENFKRVSIAVERQEDGRYLIDWESFVGYCEMGWDDLIDQKPIEPVLLRCRAKVADYYNYKFDPETWACVQLQDGSGEHTIYAYLKLDGPVLPELAKVLPLRGVYHLTLRVAHAGEGTAENQFLVSEVVNKGWVVDSGSDDDEAPDPGSDSSP